MNLPKKSQQKNGSNGSNETIHPIFVAMLSDILAPMSLLACEKWRFKTRLKSHKSFIFSDYNYDMRI